MTEIKRGEASPQKDSKGNWLVNRKNAELEPMKNRFLATISPLAKDQKTLDRFYSDFITVVTEYGNLLSSPDFISAYGWAWLLEQFKKVAGLDLRWGKEFGHLSIWEKGGKLTLYIGYKGYIFLVKRRGFLLEVGTVSGEQETLEFNQDEKTGEILQLYKKISGNIIDINRRDSGNCKAAYAILRDPNKLTKLGLPSIVDYLIYNKKAYENYLTVRNIQPLSKDARSPWGQFPMEMWQKTVVIHLLNKHFVDSLVMKLANEQGFADLGEIAEEPSVERFLDAVVEEEGLVEEEKAEEDKPEAVAEGEKKGVLL